MDVKSEKNELFERMPPAKALAIMAVPTVASQMILMIYNLADTWFIGRTNDPYMIGASSLALTVFLAEAAIANVFGTGGGSLMVRLIGEKRKDEARDAAAYSTAMSAAAALVFSLLVLIFMKPLLLLLGAGDNTLGYAMQYVVTTTVIGGIPTVLSMSMPQLLRNAGYSKEAGIGVGLGSLLNIALDPLFMFVLLPRGYEVLGAGIATMLSNFASLTYFIVIYIRVKDRTVLTIPRSIPKLSAENISSLYSVGIPAAFAIFLYDLVNIVTNRLTVDYGDIPLAAMGIVLKLERIPLNTGLGILLGMVPLIAYNYGSGDRIRMKKIFSHARTAVLILSCTCTVLFFVFAPQIVSAFIDDYNTVAYGAEFLRARCFALPFMLTGYHIVNFMNAVNKGKISFLLALIRHLVLIIPIMLIMDHIGELYGLIWSQVIADLLNTIVSVMIFRHISRDIM